MTQAQKMNAALEREVVSKLKADGFVGKFPHYRRFFPDRIEIISFPKDKYGNAFHVEASIAYPKTSPKLYAEAEKKIKTLFED